MAVSVPTLGNRLRAAPRRRTARFDTRSVVPSGAGGKPPGQFTAAPEMRTISAIFGTSAAWNAANSSAVLPTGS